MILEDGLGGPSIDAQRSPVDRSAMLATDKSHQCADLIDGSKALNERARPDSFEKIGLHLFVGFFFIGKKPGNAIRISPSSIIDQRGFMRFKLLAFSLLVFASGLSHASEDLSHVDLDTYLRQEGAFITEGHVIGQQKKAFIEDLQKMPFDQKDFGNWL